MLAPAPYSPALEYVFARKVRFDGVDYMPGSFAPKAKIGDRTMAIFCDQRIVVERAPDAVEVPPVPVSEEAAPAPAQTAEIARYTVKHKGFGRWFVVDAAGNNAAGPFRDEASANEACEGLLAIE